MSSAPDLGAIVRAKAGELLASCSLSPQQLRTFRAIADCRTPALGGHRDRCASCGQDEIYWNSCRNRHCPQCGGEARQRWLDARVSDVLPVPYFHVVFTIPSELHVFAIHAPAAFYGILLRAAGQALLDVGRTKLRATIAILTVLHTWGQELWLHPHVHCVVTGGGLSLDGQRWVRIRKVDFLFAVKVISRRFRSLVTTEVREAVAEGTMTLPPSIATPAALDSLLGLACRTDWHSYAKKPFGGPEQVLAYVAAYTHRIAISNRRILDFDGEDVTFSWHDYKEHYAAKTTTLPATEFLRRFAMHIVPPHFVRIRSYGLLANRNRKAHIARARELLGAARERRSAGHGPAVIPCPRCGAVMQIVQKIAPQAPRTWFDSS